MNYDYLIGFHPSILQVTERTKPFWDRHNYVLNRDITRVHSLGFVRHGQGVMYIDGKKFSLSEGTLFYAHPGVRLRIVTQEENVLCFDSVMFLHGALKEDGARMKWNPESEILTPLPISRVSNYLGNATLSNSFKRMVNHWSQKNLGFQWHVKLEFLQMLGQLATIDSGVSSQSNHIAELIDSTVDYICSHLSSKLDRSILAERVSLSPIYLGAVFKRRTGYALTEFIIHQRIERAKELLLSTELPIYIIADMVGYTDAFYFTRLFHKKTGITPRKFREL